MSDVMKRTTMCTVCSCNDVVRDEVFLNSVLVDGLTQVRQHRHIIGIGGLETCQILAEPCDLAYVAWLPREGQENNVSDYILHVAKHWHVHDLSSLSDTAFQ